MRTGRAIGSSSIPFRGIVMVLGPTHRKESAAIGQDMRPPPPGGACHWCREPFLGLAVYHSDKFFCGVSCARFFDNSILKT